MLSATIPAFELAKLDKPEQSAQPKASPAKISMTDRIIEAYEFARAYADQLEDPEFRQNVQQKLVRSNVRGSLIVGVKGPEDVVQCLASVRNWQSVVANLKDKEILVFQGELPETYAAYTAYASIREIAHMFDSPGLGSIQVKQGHQHPDDYYLCTMLKFPTNIITVQIKNDGGQEHLHQWFAGPEITSRGRFNDGDTIVRCGVVIPKASEQRRNGRWNESRKAPRTHRAG